MRYSKIGLYVIIIVVVVIIVWPTSFFTRESSYCFQRVLVIEVLSFCPSVRPSVHLSHWWISQKQCKLGSQNLHRRLSGRL